MRNCYDTALFFNHFIFQEPRRFLLQYTCNDRFEHTVCEQHSSNISSNIHLAELFVGIKAFGEVNPKKRQKVVGQLTSVSLFDKSGWTNNSPTNPRTDPSNGLIRKARQAILRSWYGRYGGRRANGPKL